MSSVALCRAVKVGPTLRMRTTTTAIRMGSATRNTRLRRREMPRAMIKAVMSMAGARTMMRMPICRVVCTEVTSLVRRVMREAVEKCSMLRKEKRCTCSYSAWRSCAPKPMLARAARYAADTPKTRAKSAMPIIRRPAVRIYARSPAAMPMSTMLLMTWGSFSSITASPTENSMPSRISRR